MPVEPVGVPTPVTPGVQTRAAVLRLLERYTQMSERHLCYYGKERDLLPLWSTDRARPLRATKALGEGWGRRPSESAPIYA